MKGDFIMITELSNVNKYVDFVVVELLSKKTNKKYTWQPHFGQNESSSWQVSQYTTKIK